MGLLFKINFLYLEKPLIRIYINPYHLCFPKHKESNLSYKVKHNGILFIYLVILMFV
jgi:hypothetical protein